MLSLYRRLLRLRREETALVWGRLTDVSSTNDVLQFLRSGTDERFVFVMNLAEERRQVVIGSGKIVASTSLRREGESVSGAIGLEPAEALIVKVGL